MKDLEQMGEKWGEMCVIGGCCKCLGHIFIDGEVARVSPDEITLD